jgi:adenylate kinase family enzyme
LSFSDNFAGYDKLYGGGCACGICADLIKNWRNKHFILVDGTPRELRRDELLKTMLTQPPGSLIYVKSAGRKLGMLSCLRFMATEKYAALCGEEEGFVYVDRSRLLKLAELAQVAVKTLKRRTAMVEGCRVEEWVHRELCVDVEMWRRDPAWSILTRVV